ncbi:N-acetylglucosamine-6-phosphate deacetylase [Pediococcus argentinicus]|uniref:N-acetylglucosamine-6-phosphate deacetylase n=1 Tax=Pediococcus argentinicus TaxID=480391 RepID=A0A0R2NN26_9LACO|nr:N-acetylglucosamine-6-phosphate deacetylase [Pediococcus argentinicus]KRO25405.1 n-acetylglucosamine-6-phosphate deacetylase [Pediococcus argentinicus]NKZ22265.1 N-acetylglucosamine-6-phosphate deacetylase [Pediococcus argentinicus]GEP19266.1 N-acetylglucosamine-6-phosphate deacetylase [Pediococcus argentinicus]
MSYYIYADKFFLENATENDGYLEIKDNGTFGQFSSEKPEGKIIDKKGQWIAPGLVDTHIHGLLNHDVMDNDENGLRVMSKGLLQCGVTSWLPTTLTASSDQLNDVVRTISSLDNNKGAKIQGIYFEGPYFTEKHKGAQNPKYFNNPSIEEFHKWQKSAKGMIRKIAIAPEKNGSVEFTREISSENVVVALGHSDATYDQAKACVEAGAKMFTHTYNGMSGLNHREPGMVGAAMAMDNVVDELICDGHHVHPAAVKTLIKLKGQNHIALVTDCMKAGLMPDGNYILGEFPVIVEKGTARLVDGGSLAGSILQLKDAIKNVVDWNIASPAEAIRMASATAANSAGIGDSCGKILPGREAGFIILSPNMELQETYVDGVKAE